MGPALPGEYGEAKRAYDPVQEWLDWKRMAAVFGGKLKLSFDDNNEQYLVSYE